MKSPEHRVQRAPKGVESRKPVAMRLKPEEKSELETMAAFQERSVGSLARLIYLKGLDALKRELPESVTTPVAARTMRFGGQ
jgi:hypothetical protein